MCRAFRWIGYVSTAVGFIVLIFGIIGHCCSHCTTATTGCCSMHDHLFDAANSFFLLAIALFFIATHCCCEKCCEKKEEKK